MTLYYAVVKHEVDAPPEVKLRALREGLEQIACILVEEHGWTAERVLEEYEQAAVAAEESEEYVRRYNATKAEKHE